MILPPGASAWSFLASLPWPLAFATASVVGRGFRVAGGGDGASYKSEVILRPSHQTTAKGKLLLSIINTNNSSVLFHMCTSLLYPFMHLF